MKSAKEMLLTLLEVIEREGEGENVHICEEFSTEEIKEVLKKEFGWKEPNYGKLTKNQIFEAADKFLYYESDDGQYDDLCENGLTKENKEKAMKFLLDYWKVDKITKDTEKVYFKWIKEETK